MMMNALNFLSTAAALAGADPAATPPPAQSDFRPYVFAAYGAVLAILFLFTLWSVAQSARAARKLDRLERRLDLQDQPGGKAPEAPPAR